MWDIKKAIKKGTDKTNKPLAAGAWKIPNDKKGGPGEYKITRLFTVMEGKDDDKAKGHKRFESIPLIERTILGVINKVI